VLIAWATPSPSAAGISPRIAAILSCYFAHDSSSPPIGRAKRVWTDGTRLLGDVEFAPPETYVFADTIYRLVRDGFLKSGSVGFLPLEYRQSDRRGGGIDFKRQELLEFSIVPVPANANALTQAQAKGILSRHDARRLRRAADEMPPAAIGNCGRPANEECGLKNAQECAIHRQEGGWNAGTVRTRAMQRPGTAARPRLICAPGVRGRPGRPRR
jgi:HK97 family phage prohead protease